MPQQQVAGVHGDRHRLIFAKVWTHGVGVIGWLSGDDFLDPAMGAGHAGEATHGFVGVGDGQHALQAESDFVVSEVDIPVHGKGVAELAVLFSPGQFHAATINADADLMRAMQIGERLVYARLLAGIPQGLLLVGLDEAARMMGWLVPRTRGEADTLVDHVQQSVKVTLRHGLLHNNVAVLIEEGMVLVADDAHGSFSIFESMPS